MTWLFLVLATLGGAGLAAFGEWINSRKYRDDWRHYHR